MRNPCTRRRVTNGIAAVLMSVGLATASAQGRIEIIYSDTVPENDIRSQTLKSAFGECLGSEFDFKPFHGANLFKQGTELTALQRGNLDMASLAIFDFFNQVPQTSILGTAYLFRDYRHMRQAWQSGVLADIARAVEDKARVKILSNPYIGTRHLNLRGERKVMKPADLAGIKLRMPGGEGWQFVGQAMGANPTPLAFTEVYTALQTGAIDAQDNPLPANKSMKFYEVTRQIVLTGHLVANNQFSISLKKWNTLSQAQQKKMQECANDFEARLDKVTLDQEAELIDFFKKEGLTVYEPDRTAFRNHVLDAYGQSKFSKDWPKGLLETINGL